MTFPALAFLRPLPLRVCSRPSAFSRPSPAISPLRPLFSPPTMSSLAAVQIGTGTDLHGQNPTSASVRAVRNAIEFNSLPAFKRLLPSKDLNDMRIVVKLGVPDGFVEGVEKESVKKALPFGDVQVEVVTGGLAVSSGINIPELGDDKDDDRTLVVVAAVQVYC